VFQRDYILRMIEQAAQAIARAFGFVAEKKLDDAERELASAYAALGIDRELLVLLDADTLIAQLGDPARIAAAVRVLACDAVLRAERGELAAGQRKLRAAQRLKERLGAADASLDQALASAVERLARA
jgi:hypothetical protein